MDQLFLQLTEDSRCRSLISCTSVEENSTRGRSSPQGLRCSRLPCPRLGGHIRLQRASHDVRSLREHSQPVECRGAFAPMGIHDRQRHRHCPAQWPCSLGRRTLRRLDGADDVHGAGRRYRHESLDLHRAEHIFGSRSLERPRLYRFARRQPIRVPNELCGDVHTHMDGAGRHVRDEFTSDSVQWEHLHWWLRRSRVCLRRNDSRRALVGSSQPAAAD